MVVFLCSLPAIQCPSYKRPFFRWNGDLDLIAYPARPRDGHDYLGAAGMNMYPVGSGRYDNGARSRTPSPLGREAATAAGGASSNPNLPPLREIIWRRLRRRNAQLNMLEEQAAEELRAAAAVSQILFTPKLPNLPSGQRLYLVDFSGSSTMLPTCHANSA